MERRKSLKKAERKPRQDLHSFFSENKDSSSPANSEAITSRSLKRKIGEISRIYLGKFTAKALATLSMSIETGQKLYERLPKEISKKQDTTVRLASLENSISNCKLASFESSVLYPLLKSGLVLANFASLDTNPDLKGLSSFQIDVSLYLTEEAFDVYATATIRRSLALMFNLLKNDSQYTGPIFEGSHTASPQEPAGSFPGELFPFQKEALGWIIEKENSVNQRHHMWQEITIPSGQIYFNPNIGKLSQECPFEDSTYRGGIYADEMGLGKTLVLIALVHTNTRPSLRTSKRTKVDRGGTLVVVPAQMVKHWREEIKAHANTLKVLEFSGDKTMPVSQIKTFDIVLTTYGVIESTALKNIHWFRVILDDAHSLVDKSWDYCFNLIGINRWLVTGSEISRRVKDIHPMLKFLKLQPYADYKWWNKNVLTPYSKNDKTASDLLKKLMGNILLRRTKKSLSHLVDLPELVNQIAFIEFEPEEREIYEKLHSKTLSIYNNYQDKLMGNITPMFELLMKLRQFCDHPSIATVFEPIEKIECFVSNLGTQGSEYMNHLISQIKKGQNFECPVCLDYVFDSVITKCCHVFCRLCALQQIKQNKNCPLCKQLLTDNDLKNLPKPSSGFNYDSVAQSSKVKALVHILNQDDVPTVVFSQWPAMLNVLHATLTNAGFLTAKDTQDCSSARVVLCQYKTGGVCLIGASRVILFDLCWNPRLENECIMRVHRIGQTLPVTAIRLVVKGTIEERILQFHASKSTQTEFSEEVFSISVENLSYIFNK